GDGRGFARATHPGDTHEALQRDFDRGIVEVMFAGVGEFQDRTRVARAPERGGRIVEHEGTIPESLATQVRRRAEGPAWRYWPSVRNLDPFAAAEVMSGQRITGAKNSPVSPLKYHLV